MTQIWTADDVLFAPVRAMDGDAPELVRDLLGAAGTPGSLDGVTPTRARICAAQIVHLAGDRDATIATASQALAAAPPADLGPRERLDLALLFAAAGDADRAVELATGSMAGDQTSHRHIASWIALVLQLADSGRFGHALRLCDIARDGSAGAVRRGPSGALISRIGQLVELTRREVLAMQAETEAAETDLSFVSAAASPDTARAAAVEPPAWPAVVNGHLGWWPEPEYARITRQVPELSAVLGHPWRQHISRTESALRARSRRGERGLMLVALHFGEFVGYLVRTRADPGAASVLTSFAMKSAAGQAWPPRGRDRCWCGGGSRYRDCCGRPN